MAIGLALTLTGVLAWIGVPVMIMSAWPLYRLVKKWIQINVEERLQSGN